MPKRIIGVFLCLMVLLCSAAAAAGTPDNVLTYKTLLKTDDFHMSFKTDSVIWSNQPGSEETLSLTARWAYTRPENVVRYYQAARRNLAWRISKVAIKYDPATGIVSIMELETVLYDRQGQPAVLLKNPNPPWRLLLPTDPDYEAYEKILNYLKDNAV